MTKTAVTVAWLRSRFVWTRCSTAYLPQFWHATPDASLWVYLLLLPSGTVELDVRRGELPITVARVYSCSSVQLETLLTAFAPEVLK